MIRAVTLVSPPPHLAPLFAKTLVGLTIVVRPELFEWTAEPTIGTDAHFLFLHNDDLRSALESALGEGARQYHSFLLLGRATRIPKYCCEYHYTLPITGDLETQ